MNEYAVHWLLDLMVTDPCPLDMILPVPQFLGLNVRRIPGFLPSDYFALVQQCVDTGIVRIVSGAGQVLQSIPEDFRSTPQWPKGIRNVELRLTPQGLDRWELLAQPRWENWWKSTTEEASATTEQWSLKVAAVDMRILL